MEIKDLKIGKNTVYRRYFPVDLKVLTKEIQANGSYDDALWKESNLPNIQRLNLIRGGVLDGVTNTAANVIKHELYKNGRQRYVQYSWTYTVPSYSKPVGEYHDHLKMGFVKAKGEWSWCYYVSVPEEGWISFKENDDEIRFTPKPGELVIFSSSLLHLPNPEPSSQERIVVAGTISSVNIKEKNTIL